MLDNGTAQRNYQRTMGDRVCVVNSKYFSCNCLHINALLYLIAQRESNRNNGIKLILKIFQNIANNPSQTHKYGNLSVKKITDKLSNCQPALKLLLLSGFETKQNNKRLLWTNTNENISTLKHIQNTLKSMTDTVSITNNHASKHRDKTINKQTQLDITQMITNLITKQYPV